MEIKDAIAAAARASTDLIDAVVGSPGPPGGSLTVVGTGIRAITQLTVEALAVMARAEVLLHVIGEPIQEDAILTINPNAKTMTGYYGDGVQRIDTYEAMVKDLVSSVVAGKRTVAAFYGHPGVFTYPTHEAVRRTRALGLPARMLPAVSAADCCYADLGIDPGDGSQSYEATDFLLRRHPIDPNAHLFLWQVGTLGTYTYESTGYDMSSFPALVARLNRSYPANHPVEIYEAPFNPKGRARLLRMPLAQLDGSQVTPATMLHVPPLIPSPF